MEYYDELIEIIRDKQPTKQQLARIKVQLCKKHGKKKIPTDIEVLMHAPQELIPELDRFLVTKPTRSISGVAVVAIMTKPFNCPHGTCTYCPGGPDSPFNSPKSYTGHEPSTLRGIRNDYDPYLMVFNRLEQYVVTGHNPEKVEIIVMGGTFPGMPLRYQNEFIKYMYKAMNDFSDMFYQDGKLQIQTFRDFFEMPGNVHDKERTTRIKDKLRAQKGDCELDSEKLRNESSNIRCVALCIETKPDFALQRQCNTILAHGATRVEVGIQTLSNEILKKINRGHDLEASQKATQCLKDSFLKVGYHMMPGLPDSTYDTDKEMLKELFSNPLYRPDALKIYPCMVIRGTELYDDWKKGKFTPMTTQTAAELIAEVKPFIPNYCRLMRVQRDIPTKIISAGVDRTNLRQYVDEINPEGGDIREREAGHVFKKKGKTPENVTLQTYEYESSGGTDIFIAAEDKVQDILVGFARLRMPAQPFRPEITDRTAGVRQLHVFGSAQGVTGKKSAYGARYQHAGWGWRLMEEAEKLAKEQFDANKLAVISGVGVREYYLKKGYKKDGVYVSKNL